MPKIFPFTGAKTVTMGPYTSTQNIVIPANVSVLSSVTGKGADGTAATNGYYGPNTNHSAYVVSVTGSNTSQPGISGQLYWDYIQSYASSAASKLNSTPNSSFTRSDFVQYTNGYTGASSQVSYGYVVPGSAYSYNSSGWKTSGPVSTSDLGFSYVAWQEYGTYYPGTPATTGASTTAFGITFVGGTGGPATATTVSNVAVTPGSAYTLTIPSGGYVTFQYVTS